MKITDRASLSFLTKTQVIKYLKENLSISVDQVTEFGPVETIKIELYLGEDLISESSCDLPKT